MADYTATAAASPLAGPGPLNRARFPRLEYRAPYTFFLRSNAQTPFLADQRFGAGSMASERRSLS